MSAVAISSPIFSGTEFPSLDAKNRVTIPARWRHPEEDQEDEFFLMPDRKNQFLRAMPPMEFRAVAKRVEDDPQFSPEERVSFKRRFFAGSVQVVADKQGRMLIPEDFCKLLDLRGEVAFVGMNDTFEVWNKQRYLSAAPAEAGAFDRVAGLIGL